MEADIKQRAQIHAIAASGTGYVWKWRDVDRGLDCKSEFTLYYDCLTDARKHGYEIDLVHAQGLTAPGGLDHQMP